MSGTGRGGTVLPFPSRATSARENPGRRHPEPCVIVILPVIRIETLPGVTPPKRKRRPR